jgi:hypothetical protein
MKNTWSAWLVSVLLVTLVTPVLAAQPSFGEMCEHLDRRKQTKIYVEEYWKGKKGTEVTWAGEVHDVSGGKSKAKVYIADKSRPTYKGYNIILVTPDVPKAATLKKGQKIRFKGYLDDYDSKDIGVIIELKEGQIL